MLVDGLKTLVRRWWPTLGAVVGVVGYLLWRQLVPDLPARLFPLLPDDHGLYVYVDVGAVRQAARFADPASVPGWELIDRRDSFAAHRAFLSDADIEGAAISIGEYELRALLSGQFTAPVLKAHIEQQGGRCSGASEDFTCSIDSAQATTQLRLAGNGVLEIIDRSPLAGNPVDSGDASFLAIPARQGIRDGAVVWMALQPARLEAVMKDPPRAMMNLTLFARALRQATWTYATLGYSPVQSALQLDMEAFTQTPEEAEEMHRVLAGLNQFVIAAIDSEATTPDPWSQVLRTAEFAQQDTTVVGTWQIDPALLRDPR